MATLTVNLDELTEKGLREMSDRERMDVTQVAARLLRRAVRAARPRRAYDTETLKAAYAEFAEEDEALAESGAAERAELLAQEDQA